MSTAVSPELTVERSNWNGTPGLNVSRTSPGASPSDCAWACPAKAARQASPQSRRQVISRLRFIVIIAYGTVIVKVSVAESLPRKAVAPLVLETNNPRNRVIELRSAAVLVICVAVPAVVPMLLYGPAPAAASRNIRMVGCANVVLTKVLIIAVVDLKAPKAGCKRYGVE